MVAVRQTGGGSPLQCLRTFSPSGTRGQSSFCEVRGWGCGINGLSAERRSKRQEPSSAQKARATLSIRRRTWTGGSTGYCSGTQCVAGERQTTPRLQKRLWKLFYIYFPEHWGWRPDPMTLGPCALASSCRHDVVVVGRGLRTTARLRAERFPTRCLPRRLGFSLLRGLFPFFPVCGLLKAPKFHQGISRCYCPTSTGSGRKWQSFLLMRGE